MIMGKNNWVYFHSLVRDSSLCIGLLIEPIVLAGAECTKNKARVQPYDGKHYLYVDSLSNKLYFQIH